MIESDLGPRHRSFNRAACGPASERNRRTCRHQRYQRPLSATQPELIAGPRCNIPLP